MQTNTNTAVFPGIILVLFLSCFGFVLNFDKLYNPKKRPDMNLSIMSLCVYVGNVLFNCFIFLPDYEMFVFSFLLENEC